MITKQLNKSFTASHTLMLAVFVSAMLLGRPARSQADVVLSSRWFHPKDDRDTLSTIKIAKAFNVTRIDWMYCNNKTQLQQLQQLNIPYSLAINPQTPDSAGYTTAKTRILDINGNPLVAPWMKKWKVKNPYWGCVNNPLFKETFYTQTKNIVDLGAYGVFVDDARFNDHAAEWGGCYCDYCMTAFNKYLESKNESLSGASNYREFLKTSGANAGSPLVAQLKKEFRQFQSQSVVNFLTTWKADLSAYAKRPFKFLTNNYNGNWDSPIYKVFDGGIAEIPSNKEHTTGKIGGIVKKATAFGKTQVFSYASDNMTANAKFIIQAYLAGSAAIIPWDALVSSNVENNYSQRYYANTDQYLKLFDFISGHPGLFKNTISTKEAAALNLASSSEYITELRRDKTGTYLFICAPDSIRQAGDISSPVTFKNISGAPLSMFDDITPCRIMKSDNGNWNVNTAFAILKIKPR